ncbi:MAG TPA: hypothetical protein VGC54_09385 [Planctomycetota bacterium]
MPVPVAILLAAALTSGGALHIPHDNVNAIAAAPRAAGGQDLLVVLSIDTGLNQVFHSADDGLTWDSLRGAGIENAYAVDVVHHAALPSDGGSGLFVIATNSGAFAYHPTTGRVEAWSDGLFGDDLEIVRVAAPMAGSDGPVAMITLRGRIFLRAPGAPAWSLSYDSGLGVPATRLSLEVEAHFDPLAAPGVKRLIVASINKRMVATKNGGASWLVVPRWSAPVADTSGALINDLALAENFQSSGQLVVCLGDRAVESGEIWTTRDYGRNWMRTFQSSSEILALVAAPPGPGGKRRFFAAPTRNPFRREGTALGILRSGDGGLTWSDNGNAQDFVTRRGEEDAIQVSRVVQLLDFAVAPGFAVNGVLWNGRDQGLFRSATEGSQWFPVRTRPEFDTRDLAGARDAAGHARVFGGAYGSGVVDHDLTAGTARLLDAGATEMYMKVLAASPNFAVDGSLYAGGGDELRAWFDPAQPADNPFGTLGWTELPRANPGEPTEIGYPRSLALAPGFHNGLGGFVKTLYWDVFTMPPMRSFDGGQTAEIQGTLSAGGTAPFMKELKIAPTYDDATRNDVYGLGSPGKLFRLANDQWDLAADLLANGIHVAIDPGFSRPGNPHLFVATRTPSQVLEIVDDPAGAIVTPWTAGIEDVAPTDVVLAEDFATNPIVYLSTVASGVFRMNLADATPQFTPVGSGFPRRGIKALLLSPDYLSDGVLLAATSEGVWACADVPGAVWTRLPFPFFRDNLYTAIHPFAPNDPGNPQPLRAWSWKTVSAGSLPVAADVRGPDIAYTTHTGSWLWTDELAREIYFHTLSGPGMGTLTLTVDDRGTGANLSTQVVDLRTLSAQVENHAVEVLLAGPTAVHITATVQLDAGEVVAFDGFGFVR